MGPDVGKNLKKHVTILCLVVFESKQSIRYLSVEKRKKQEREKGYPGSFLITLKVK